MSWAQDLPVLVLLGDGTRALYYFDNGRLVRTVHNPGGKRDY